MIFRNLLCAVVLTFLLPFQLFAWGNTGHQMIAQYAMRQLSNETRAKVLQVLGTMTPEQAGTWIDDVRGESAYKYMAPWHHAYAKGDALYRPAVGGDIITALNKAYGELQHMGKLSPEQVRMDVLILFYLCGDITQPLNIEYDSDNGGNTYQV